MFEGQKVHGEPQADTCIAILLATVTELAVRFQYAGCLDDTFRTEIEEMQLSETCCLSCKDRTSHLSFCQTFSRTNRLSNVKHDSVFVNASRPFRRLAIVLPHLPLGAQHAEKVWW